MGNTTPVKTRAACAQFIEITNTQTGETYLLNVKKIIQVTKLPHVTKIWVSGGVASDMSPISYEIHKDCYSSLLSAIQEAQGPPMPLDRWEKRDGR